MIWRFTFIFGVDRSRSGGLMATDSTRIKYWSASKRWSSPVNASKDPLHINRDANRLHLTEFFRCLSVDPHQVDRLAANDIDQM